MAIQDKHPLYSKFLADWEQMRDTYRGERVIKERGLRYLPPTSGMSQDGMSPSDRGYRAYMAYKHRAVFHDFVSDAVEAMVGVMHAKPPVIELPEAMEPMRERATINGESLELLLRRVNEQQLVTGRLGLLLDLPATPTTEQPQLYIAMYLAENIINWDDGARDELTLPELNMVVLDESEFERGSDFTWEFVNKYRVLMQGDAQSNEPQGTYRTAVFRDASTSFSEEALLAPSIRGNVLDQLPFVFVNTKDIVASPDDPPLLGLSGLSLAIYRGEADYRQNLFMQGQDTLVVIGGDPEESYRIGAGATITPPQGGDAKFIGVSAEGLGEQRQSLENDKRQAVSKSGALAENETRERESGEALKIRVAARTATLNSIALTGAAALQELLRRGAKWMGLDPETVKVTPNLDFAAEELTGKTLVELMTARNLGAPLSRRSVHRLMKDKDLTEMEYEEELDEIDEEEPLGGSGTGVEDDPNG